MIDNNFKFFKDVLWIYTDALNFSVGMRMTLSVWFLKFYRNAHMIAVIWVLHRIAFDFVEFILGKSFPIRDVLPTFIIEFCSKLIVSPSLEFSMVGYFIRIVKDVIVLN